MINIKEVRGYDFFNEDSVYLIPIFQRNYEWSSLQIDQFLETVTLLVNDSLLDVPKIADYFMGSIVTSQLLESNEWEAESSILDGQQRITTITIFVLCLYKFLVTPDVITFLPKDKIDYYKGECLSLIMTKGREIRTKKIYSREKDDDALNNIIRNYDFRDILSIKEENSNRIEVNAKKIAIYIKSLLTSESFIILEQFYKFDTWLNKIVFSHTTTDDYANQNLLFENINSTGMPLKFSDMVKNYLILNSEDKKSQFKVDRLWKSWEECIDDYKSDMNNFLRIILTIFYGSDFDTKTNKYKENELYIYFKRIIENNYRQSSDKTDINKLVDHMNIFFYSYQVAIGKIAFRYDEMYIKEVDNLIYEINNIANEITVYKTIIMVLVFLSIIKTNFDPTNIFKEIDKFNIVTLISNANNLKWKMIKISHLLMEEEINYGDLFDIKEAENIYRKECYFDIAVRKDGIHKNWKWLKNDLEKKVSQNSINKNLVTNSNVRYIFYKYLLLSKKISIDSSWQKQQVKNLISKFEFYRGYCEKTVLSEYWLGNIFVNNSDKLISATDRKNINYASWGVFASRIQAHDDIMQRFGWNEINVVNSKIRGMEIVSTILSIIYDGDTNG